MVESIEVEFSLMSDETSKKIQVPLLVTSDHLDYPIIGYNVIDEFVLSRVTVMILWFRVLKTHSQKMFMH